jgi:predicted CXXCH cytochrome family protein
MKNKPKNNVAYYISIVMITLFFGCSMEQSHKTLLFFFDGVEKVQFFNDYLSKDSLTKISTSKREALLKKNRPDLCVHKPYKEKKCEECHTPDKRLLMPMPGLCFKCHTNFNETYSTVHGPVASGNCTNCHNQHSSKYPKLLIRQGQQLCLYCHNSPQIFSDKVHKEIEDAECTLCHNPHGGNNRYMMKANISKDANKIALMDEITYRHLYGQIFCKEPGDVKNIVEVFILDSRETIVSVAHPDAEGKFYIANLHPDQSYGFRFKADMPNCKINVTDNNGTVLYVIEKNKKGKYVFDKTAYETVHTAINDAHFLGDTVVTPYTRNLNGSINIPETVPVVNNNVTPGKVVTPIVKTEKPAVEPVPDNKGKIIVTAVPDNVSTEELLKANRAKDTSRAVPVVENQVIDTATYKGKIKVTEVPENVTTKEFIDRNKVPDAEKTPVVTEEKKEPEANTGKGKIVVNALPVNVNEGKKTKKGAGSTAAIRRYEADGTTLLDLSLQVAKFYDGTVVCVLNDSAEYLDIAKVNAKGEFLLYDFLSYKIEMPDTGKHIVSQTIFLNERMEVIESINKRLVNGRYVSTSNSKESMANRVPVRISANRENAVLFASVMFDIAKSDLSADGRAELDRVIEYMAKNPRSKVYLACHSDPKESAANKKLSDARVKSATDYLLSKGIGRNRITRRGFGASMPINKKGLELSPEEKQKRNRRLEIYIKNYWRSY